MPIGALMRKPLMGALMPQAAQPFGALMPMAVQDQVVDPTWYRPDGSMKGRGYFGPIPTPDGRTATELSIGVEMDGKNYQIPNLVPGVTREQIDAMISGGKITPAELLAAKLHFMKRFAAGLSPYAQEDEPTTPLPNWTDTELRRIR